MDALTLFLIGLAAALGWFAFKVAPKVWRAYSKESPQEPARPPMSSADRRAIALEIKRAEDAGGSYWVEGAAIAEKHGVTIWDATDDYLLEAERRDAEAERARIKKELRDIPNAPIDLRTDNGVTVRVVGSSNWVDDKTLYSFNRATQQLYLRREPTNTHDANAVAVYAGKRKFGYISRAGAAKYAPLLDQMGSEFAVTTDPSTDRLSFFMPRLPQLRKLVAESLAE
ncbi:HIRAN domain-containing protein [Leucobacter sp. W1038]|uniref:HIRAN domain-containing protein n=1 Tax=Leucobacter sp. W1038 TaxID=3438281 RepID=UPI003D99D843